MHPNQEELERRRLIAEREFTRYDLGDLDVEDSSGMEYDSSGTEFSFSFFVRHEDDDFPHTEHMKFVVSFNDDGAVREAYARQDSGNVVGRRGEELDELVTLPVVSCAQLPVDPARIDLALSALDGIPTDSLRDLPPGSLAKALRLFGKQIDTDDGELVMWEDGQAFVLKGDEAVAVQAVRDMPLPPPAGTH